MAPTPLPLAHHVLLHTDSIEEACAAYARLGWPIEAEPLPVPAAFECWVSHATLGALSVLACWFRAGVVTRRAPAADEFSLVVALAGSGEVVQEEAMVVVVPGRTAALVSRSGPAGARLLPGYTGVEIAIPRAMVEVALAAQLGRRAQTLRFAPELSLETGAGVAVDRLVRFFVEEADREGSVLAMPQVAASFGELLVHTLVSGLSLNHSVRVATPRAAPNHVRLAEKYLEDNLAAPIALADLAAVTGVSVRTLQAGFRTHRGCSPLAFLRELRLLRARTELLSGRAASVTAVALDCGFQHFGRFSAQYRGRFGETPAKTLRCARSG